MDDPKALQALGVAVLNEGFHDLQGLPVTLGCELPFDRQQDAYEFFHPEDLNNCWLDFWCAVSNFNTLDVHNRALKAGTVHASKRGR